MVCLMESRIPTKAIMAVFTPVSLVQVWVRAQGELGTAKILPSVFYFLQGPQGLRGLPCALFLVP